MPAAGFFAAIAAKQNNPEARVTIFERGQKVLAKVLVTGGGRCNLTNSFARIGDLKQAYPRGDKMMKRLFNVFDHDDTWRWFEERGVKLLTQEDECVFPVSQSAQSVVDALTKEAHRLGVEVRTGHALEGLKPLPNGDLQLEFKAQNRLRSIGWLSLRVALRVQKACNIWLVWAMILCRQCLRSLHLILPMLPLRP